MGRPRCPDCNRWQASDRQWHRWMNWATSTRRTGILHNLAQPLWWRLDTTCLGWNDCPTQYPPGMRPVRWWVRWAFHVSPSEWEEESSD